MAHPWMYSDNDPYRRDIRKLKRIAAGAAALLILASGSVGATDPRIFMTDTLMSAPRLLDRYEVPSVGIAVTEGDEVIWNRRFGERTRDDVFEVASLSKTATALAVLRLVEKGQIDLDAPVNGYLHRWKVPESRFDEDGVTTRRLLSHTAGLPLSAFEAPPLNSPAPSIVEVLRGEAQAPAARVVKKPGAGFTYSNPGYGVLELLVEEVTQMSFSKAMRTLVFKPLGMDDSGFQDDQDLLERVVLGYEAAGTPAGQRRRIGKAWGGMMSSSNDIGRLLVGVTHPKNAGGLLAPDTLEDMHAVPKAARGAFGLGTGGGYALGIAVGKLPSGRTFVANNGSHVGYNALMLSVPEDGSGFAVLTNSETGLGVELELALKWFDDVTGEKPVFASRVEMFRTGLRWAVIAAIVLLFAYLVMWTVNARRGRRRVGRPSVWRVLFKGLVPFAFAFAIVTAFNTGTVTAGMGGIPPARFIAGDFELLVWVFAVLCIGASIAATIARKQRRMHEDPAAA